MKTNFKSAISTFQMLIIIVIGYFFVWPYIEQNFIYKDTPKYVAQFKDAIEDFTEQKNSVKDAYKEAINSQQEAKKIKYNFKHEKTKLFIEKWKNAEGEITTLKEKFINYKEETENFVDALDDKLDEIKNDEALKTKMQDYSKEKARKLAKNIIQIEKNITQLEKSIEKGNNLIIALETVSSFNQLSKDVKDFDILLHTSNQIFTDMDALVKEGFSVLDSELK
jgi:chromosome segregation ATPase